MQFSLIFVNFDLFNQEMAQTIDIQELIYIFLRQKSTKLKF